MLNGYSHREDQHTNGGYDFRYHDWMDGGGEGRSEWPDAYQVPDPPKPGIMLLLSLTLAVIIVCSIALGMALEALLLLA
jgi:hypothetical protein